MSHIEDKFIKDVVVFDLDKTLLSNDSVKTWLILQYGANIFRLCLTLIISSITFLLLNFKPSQSFAASLFVWCATCGLTEQELKENFQQFAIKIKSQKIPNLYWYRDGLSELKKHLAKNRQVIIATAAPEILTTILFESLALNVTLPLKPKYLG